MNNVRAFIFKPKRRVGGKVQVGEFYHLRYRLPGESHYKEKSLGVRDRAVAEERRREFVRELEAEAAGIIESKALRDCAQKPVTAHLADYIADLQARGKDEMYTYTMKKRLEVLVSACAWRYPKDVTADSFLAWRVAHKDKAAKTLNDYLCSASALLKWMERHGRIKANSLRLVSKCEARGKEKRLRRALSIEELRKLIAVAGPRALAYLVLVLTGLRRGEFEALEWGDVILDTPRPFLRVRASTTKNHKGATIFLHTDLIGLLRQLRQVGCGSGDRVFERCPSVAELKADLAAAGIPFVDAQGCRFDVHAFRHTLATILANCGVPRRVAMDMMRHSDSRLTDRTYTDSSQLMTASAVAMLPSVVATHTQNHTQDFGSGDPVTSSDVQFSVVEQVEETLGNKGESQPLANVVQICPPVEIGCLARTRT